jgi:hypothetical protein
VYVTGVKGCWRKDGTVHDPPASARVYLLMPAVSRLPMFPEEWERQPGQLGAQSGLGVPSTLGGSGFDGHTIGWEMVQNTAQESGAMMCRDPPQHSWPAPSVPASRSEHRDTRSYQLEDQYFVQVPPLFVNTTPASVRKDHRRQSYSRP